MHCSLGLTPQLLCVVPTVRQVLGLHAPVMLLTEQMQPRVLRLPETTNQPTLGSPYPRSEWVSGCSGLGAADHPKKEMGSLGRGGK